MMRMVAIATAATASVGFLLYCIYFDRKRRSDPDFKKKLKQRRLQNRQNQSKSKIQFPSLTDAEAMQRFFLQQVQLGEDLLASGQMEEGLDHLSYAVAVTAQPQQLLQVLQQTLPPNAYQLLVKKLPKARQMAAQSQGIRIVQSSTGGGASGSASGKPSAFDELE